MKISANNLQIVSKSNCRVGKISSSRVLDEEKLITEMDFQKENLEILNDTITVEVS
ncbi:hypothetical protein ACFX5F_14685 [Flavobacterium sp. ZS1P70]|uniref:Auto-transporter adhesin head GIN domain-containing protein n=1 Tax=Flavobacterium zhoui TaxID=3230414 RepID=A0ABW6I867_9FLAO